MEQGPQTALSKTTKHIACMDYVQNRLKADMPTYCITLFLVSFIFSNFGRETGHLNLDCT